MELFIIIIFFLFGLVFGSFFNVVGYRLPKEESIVNPPSHCPSCNKRLTPLELIPVLSYLIQRGKCRNCKTKIGLFYPIFELITGILFAITYIMFGLNVDLFISLIFVSSLIIIFISDYQTMIIPDEIIIFAILAKVIYALVSSDISLIGILLNGLIAASLMLLLKKFGDKAFKRESMGGGDIKLLFVFGMYLGFELAIITIFLSSFIALPYSLYILNKNKEHVVPYGPFLAIAALLLYLSKVDFMSIVTMLS